MLEISGAKTHQHEPIEVDGVALESTVAPSSGEELAACLRELGASSCAVVIRGGGTRIGFGNAPTGAQGILSTRGLAAVREFDEEDGVVLVEGGARVSEVQEEVGASGWNLSLDAPGESSTVGGVLASAASGPRVTGFGPVRDFVLGLEVVLGSGERTRCGGRVVKNVTGYDLAKLYVGSLGVLGVIEAAWLRLQPAPEASELRTRRHAEAAPALAAVLHSARKRSGRAAALLSPRAASALGVQSDRPGDLFELCELAGDAATVERDAQDAGDSAGSELLVRLRDLQGESLAGSGIRGRFSVLPSALGDLWQRLSGDSELSLVAYPGAGLLYATWRSEDERAGGRRAEEVAAALVDASRRHGTGLFFEELPLAQKQSRDVFVDAPALELQRALKQQFDPKGILNPGRFAGRI